MIEATSRASLVFGVVALLLTAGCIGFGGDGAETNNATNETNNTSTLDQEEDQEEWSRENRSGSVPATSSLVGDQAAEESFDVNASVLVLNLTADGGELDMCIQKAGGNETRDERDAGAQDDCDETVTTQDGNATFEASEPESGEWTVRLSAADASSSEIEYQLEIAQKVEADGDGASYGSNAVKQPL